MAEQLASYRPQERPTAFCLAAYFFFFFLATFFAAFFLATFFLATSRPPRNVLGGVLAEVRAGADRRQVARHGNQPKSRPNGFLLDADAQHPSAGRLLTLLCTSIRCPGREIASFPCPRESQFGIILTIWKTFASGQVTNGRKNSMLLRMLSSAP